MTVPNIDIMERGVNIKRSDLRCLLVGEDTLKVSKEV